MPGSESKGQSTAAPSSTGATAAAASVEIDNGAGTGLATRGAAADDSDPEIGTEGILATPAESITALTEYLRMHPEIRHIVSELEVEGLTVHPLCKGTNLAGFVFSFALNAYAVQVYIKPTNRHYADNEFRLAFLIASLVYNNTLMTYFGSQPFISFLRMLTASREERHAILSSTTIWLQELSELTLASIAAVMMVDVAKQDGFSSIPAQIAMGTAFTLLTKSGAGELINDAIKPLLGEVVDRVMLLQPDFFCSRENTWRRDYILMKQRQRAVKSFQSLTDAAITYIRTHRDRLTTTPSYTKLAMQLTNIEIPEHTRQALLLKTLFELPVTAPEPTPWGRALSGLATTVVALTVTLSSQVGLYRNAVDRGGLIGTVTGAVNACMSLLMAKSLGQLVRNLNAMPASLATLSKMAFMAIVSALVFAGGLLTGGTTADEIAIYYKGKLPDGLFDYLEDCAYGGSAFFNGYGLICMIAALVVVNDLTRRTTFTEDPSHLEAVLIANLENLKRLFEEADSAELIATLQQLHNDEKIDLDRVELQPFFDLTEFRSGTTPSEALGLLHRGGDDFVASLSPTHSYRVSLRWFQFIVNDVLLQGGIIGARYAAMALIPAPAGNLLKTVEAYLASGAAAGLHKAAEQTAACCRSSTTRDELTGALLARRDDILPEADEDEDDDAIAAEASCCSTSRVCATLNRIGKVVASSVLPIVAGTAAELGSYYAATGLFEMDPEPAQNAATAIGVLIANAATYIPSLRPKSF